MGSRWSLRVVGLSIGCAFCLLVGAAAADAAVGKAHVAGGRLSEHALSSFDEPMALAVVGEDVWVANEAAVPAPRGPTGSLTELDASTGMVLDTLPFGSYHLWGPDALTVSGADLYVGNFTQGCGCVTEVNVTSGAYIRALGLNKSWSYNGAVTSVAVSGADVWIAEGNLGRVVELATTTGHRLHTLTAQSVPFSNINSRRPGPISLVSNGRVLFGIDANGSVVEIKETTARISKVISAQHTGLDAPSAAISLDGNLWVSDAAGSTALVEIDETTGAVVRRVSDGAIGLSDCTAIASDGNDLWLADSDAVAEINATTGAELLHLSAPSYRFDGVSSLATDGTHLWATNAAGNSVTEIANSSGALTRVITNAS